ncbi:MAG: hypothetical protein KF846_17470 [Cyclobacteriaceae bacterium]|nr:hypothetical protein [Cyclobacteriaceae bacterium]
MVKYCCALVLLIFYSCDFKPDGEIFTTLTPPSAQGATIDLNGYQDEIINLKSKVVFTYTVNTGNNTLLESKVLLNGTIIWVSSFPTGTFELDPSKIGTGSHTLKIEFTAQTNTGSLAEKIGAEVLYVWLEKTVVVDNYVPQNPDDPLALHISSVENRDNAVWITWNHYPSFNFEKYQVTRTDYDTNGNYLGEWDLPAITDQEVVSIGDYQYLGGHSVYKVILTAAGKTYTSPGFSFDINYEPDITYTIENGNVTVNWKSLKALSTNLAKYRLEVITPVGGYTNVISFELNNVLDTVVVFQPTDFFFGSVKNMKLIMVPKTNPGYSKVYTKKLKYGDSFPSFHSYVVPVKYDAEIGSYFFMFYDTFYKADSFGSIVDSLTNFSSVFINDNQTGIGNYGISGSSKVLVDLNQMQIIQVLNIDNSNHALAISNDNRYIISTTTGTKIFSSSVEVLFNLGSFSSNYIDYEFSSNGKYSNVSSRVHVLSDSGYHIIPWFPHGLKSLDFSPDIDDVMVVGFSDRIMKFDLLNQTTIAENYNYGGPCNIDPVSKKLGCLNNGEFVILNQQDFSEEKRISVDKGAGTFYLLNNKLLCSSGVQLDIGN